ncbi:hypothetical protein SAMN02982990_03505 [Photorhabdus luminescens]|uniref:Uncharacterized protein n=1 Tax=Photorhabdus luminescens TaxID=29488 RepID=A0A1G5R8T3_PHOLU|nr:hypothetical protein SAMN02982990_03505 [Photorhabdus luminescens]
MKMSHVHISDFYFVGVMLSLFCTGEQINALAGIYLFGFSTQEKTVLRHSSFPD